MLKFQNNNTTFSVNFEDFILIVFVIIDDLYKKYAPAAISHLIRISSAKLSDPEIITISICGELFGFDSENALFNYIDKNYRYLFPNLCSRSRFNRTRRNLLKLTNILFQKLQYIFNSFDSAYYIVDSFPLPVCKFGRAKYCNSFRGSADYGRCASKKETYFGFKVHALTTPEGFITNYEITPASIDDRAALRDLIFDKTDIIVIGDKGYTDKALTNELKCQDINLMTLKRSNSKIKWSKETQRMIFSKRRRIETTFSQLSEQLNAEKVLAKSTLGLYTRMLTKVFAYDICILINKLSGNEYNCSRIKQLIF